MSESFKLKTEIGEFTVNVYDAGRVGVEAGGVVNVEEIKGGKVTTRTGLMVNRVMLKASGSWEFKPDFGGWRPSYFSVKRLGGGWNGRKFVEPPRAASSKVYDIVREALNNWSKSGEAARLLGEAGIAALNAEAEHLEQKAKDCDKEAAEYRKQAQAKRDEAQAAPKTVKHRAAPSFIREEVK